MLIKQNILKGILSIIEKISDGTYQQKAWVERKIHPYATFEESMHHLFDDYEFNNVVNNYESYGISKDQYKILEFFRSSIDHYSNEKMLWLQCVNPKEILEDTQWHEIQKMAKDVLETFHYLTE